MKTCLLVAPHFPPSNLASVHRARLWSRHLPEFGWKPIILTTHSGYYEEALDWDLQKLLPSDLEIIATKALPTKPIRLVGDIGVRAFPYHLAAAAKLAKARKIDFMHITIPANFSALLGRPLRALRRVPYGIDYIDPWVHDFPGSDKKLSKAWISCTMAKLMEPWAVKQARAITGITEGYFAGVLERNPHLHTQAATGFMPYGAEVADFVGASEMKLANPQWSTDGKFHGFYAGALLPKAMRPLETLFQVLRKLGDQSPTWRERFRLHFVGTGGRPSDPKTFQVKHIAERFGIADMVTEHPHRMAYLQVLAHLHKCDGALVLGSSEAHYSPSKTFQSIQSGKPILALLHEESTAVSYLRQVGGADVVTMTDAGDLDQSVLASALTRWFQKIISVPPDRVNSIPNEQTARGSAQRLSEVLDAALALEIR